MKKLTKILALALAVAMMLGMTALAVTPATKVYYENDFKQYNGKASVITNEFVQDSNALLDNGDHIYNVSTWRDNGKTIVSNRPMNNDSFLKFELNADGNYQPIFNGQWTDASLHYIAPESWDVTNTDEVYVISADIDPVNFRDAYYYMQMIGNKGTKEEPVYGRARLVSQNVYYINADGTPVNPNPENGGALPTRGTFAAITTEQHMGDNLGLTAGGDIKRVAFGFSYNAETGKLERDAATDGVLKTLTKENFELGDMKSVDGVGFMHYASYKDISESNRSTQSAPLYSRIRMYTIDKTAGFTAESEMNGEKDVASSTNKVTIKFNQPVGNAAVAVTADGKAVSGVTTKIRDISAEGKVYSEVDVLFANGVGYGKNYSIDLSNVTNEIGTKCDSDPITFTTVAAPSFDVSYSEGLKEGVAITDGNYAGKTVYVKAVATNGTSIAFDGKVIIGIYDAASGNLVKYASATKSIAVGGSATFAAAFKLAAGQTIEVELQ